MNDFPKSDHINFRYTRAMAIADGILIDAGLGKFAEVSRQHFPGINLAMTDSVFQLIAVSITSAAGCDFSGCWHNILWMAQRGPDELLGNGRIFKVGFRNTQSLQWHTLKILFHPGDHGEPCATVMLPNED